MLQSHGPVHLLPRLLLLLVSGRLCMSCFNGSVPRKPFGARNLLTGLMLQSHGPVHLLPRLLLLLVSCRIGSDSELLRILLRLAGFVLGRLRVNDLLSRFISLHMFFSLLCFRVSNFLPCLLLLLRRLRSVPAGGSRGARNELLSLLIFVGCLGVGNLRISDLLLGNSRLLPPVGIPRLGLGHLLPRLLLFIVSGRLRLSRH